MVDMVKMCKGCTTYERHIEDSENYSQCEGHMKKHVDCPCQNCLIKVMCDDVCEEYREKWKTFYFYIGDHKSIFT